VDDEEEAPAKKATKQITKTDDAEEV